jgi:ribosomal protein L15
MKTLTLELTEKAREKIEKWGGVAHVIVRRIGGG